MRRIVHIAASIVLPLAVLAEPQREKLGFDPATQLDSAASIYFAPENSILFRMRNPDGSYREFQRSFDKPNRLWGVRGWHGKIREDTVLLRSGEEVDGGMAEYIFKQGRLTFFKQGSVQRRFDVDMPRPPTDGTPPFVFGDEAKWGIGDNGSRKSSLQLSREARREVAKKWKKSGRLCVPFANPNENGMLFMTLAFLVSFLFFSSRPWVKVVGGILFLAACGGMVLASSRGAFLGFVVGLVPVVALRFKAIVRSKAVWVLCAFVLLGATAWFATHESRLITRGFTKQSKWSNNTRLEMWSTAPTMMAEAPNGWYHMHIGRSYLDWYQDLDEVSLAGSLINEHLTRLVSYSRIGRFLYLFCWLLALGQIGYVCWRKRNGIALGLGLAMLVAGWFNPVYVNKLLWIVPGIALLVFLCDRSWKYCRVRPMTIILGAAALLAVGIQYGLIMWGGAKAAKRGYPIRVDKGRVYVKGMNPQVWIADDGKALGGVLACKDIRGYYAYDPRTPSVGYVTKLKNLPNGIDRLVLAGEMGDKWMQMMSKGGVDIQAKVPKEVVFITPPFPPSALPEGFLKSCKVSIVIGEFTARYEPEYANPPSWVKVVPGMELYINGWMQYALGIK